MFIITFSCARFINKIFYFAKVYVFYLIAKAFVVNYSKTQRFSMFMRVLQAHFPVLVLASDQRSSGRGE